MANEVKSDALPFRFSDPIAVAAELQREAIAMNELVGVCPFPSLEHVAMGGPGYGYPLPWSIQTWLPGEIPSTFSRGGRGGDISDSDEWMEICFEKSEGLLDVPASVPSGGTFASSRVRNLT